MDKIDHELKAYLESARGMLPARDRLDTYPAAEDYRLFIMGALEGQALVRMLDHLKTDSEGQKLVRGARALLEASAEAASESVPAAVEARARNLLKGSPQARCPHCGQGITPFRKPIAVQKAWSWVWVSGAVISFTLSFAFPYRFMQFLVLTLLFGVKWIVDRRAQKTQILIYKALSENKDTPHEHLHRASSHL